MPRYRAACASLSLSLALLPLCFAPPAAVAAEKDPLLTNLPWRCIGPAVMGGRIDAFAVVEGRPGTLYVGTASSGLFKTINNGTTWEPVFDAQPVGTIGDVAVAPSDPEVVWVGTGEANNRQSSSWGDGVYRSTDGGKTWAHVGLAGTMHIGGIVVDPRSAATAYVAAVGRLWGPSRERGLYKTADAGKTWRNILYVNEDTGCTDVVMDPQRPDTLYAATYQRRRTAFGFNGGGSGSGIYKTVDAGTTWRRLTQGLPAGDTGRIGLAVYRKDPRIVMATVENAAGGVFRSEDGGETWRRLTAANPRPMYFSRIRIDPNDDRRVWMLGVPVYTSEDGGKTFRTDVVSRIHVDFHALWIDPANSDHMIAGSDGGVHLSYDRGRTWDYANTLPLAQFYEVAYDFNRPYWVYGGLQDNGSWGAPSSTTYVRGSSNDEWIRIGGGDGFYCQVDPSNPDIVYSESQNGFLSRLNRATGERKMIQPRSPQGEPPYRFDWNTPIQISPHDPRRLYLGGNRLFISPDRGDTWERTEDLTTQPDRTRLPIMGVRPGKGVLSLHDGQSSFGQIVTLAESPLRAGLLWVGTDDGCLQVSRDGGQTWRNVAANLPGVPRGTYISRVVPSRFAENRAYVTLDGHRGNDFKPYLYVTEDGGETWAGLAGALPEGGVVHVVREHPRAANLLFAGTEWGAWVSFDRGSHWAKFGAPLPPVPVHDIQIHPRENDLIFATHGRGVWILDDIAPLEARARGVEGGVRLYPPRTAVSYRVSFHKGDTGHRIFLAPNAPGGALLQYNLREKPAEDATVKLTVLARDGRTVVRELTRIPHEAGINRVNWDLRYSSPVPGPSSGPSQPSQEEEIGGRVRGPRVLPGSYVVRLTVGREEQTCSLRVEDDPRVRISGSARRAQFEALMRLRALYRTHLAVRRTVQEAVRSLAAWREGADAKKAPASVKGAAEALARRAADLETAMARGRQSVPTATGEAPVATETPGEAPPRAPQGLLERISQTIGDLDSVTEAPSAAARATIGELQSALRGFIDEANDLAQKGIRDLNRQILAAGLKPLTAPSRVILLR